MRCHRLRLLTRLSVGGRRCGRRNVEQGDGLTCSSTGALAAVTVTTVRARVDLRRVDMSRGAGRGSKVEVVVERELGSPPLRLCFAQRITALSFSEACTQVLARSRPLNFPTLPPKPAADFHPISTRARGRRVAGSPQIHWPSIRIMRTTSAKDEHAISGCWMSTGLGTHLFESTWGS